MFMFREGVLRISLHLYVLALALNDIVYSSLCKLMIIVQVEE